MDDPATIRQLSLGSSVKSLEGLDLFPNLESLTIDADDMSDVNEVVALGQLKSLTLEDADAISDFAVFAAMGNLEELYIESENLKSLDFLKRMPQLKSLGLSDGELLSLDGIEALEGLERLSVTDCGELKSMDAVATLTGLTELSLEKPYNCEEPSLAGLTGLKRLTLDNFDSCAFLSKLTELEELTLRSCDMPSNIDLSGLTQLKRLTCTTFYQDRSLAFVKNISSLEYLNLGGMVTYEDISGIFALPNIRELKLSGMECEIDFDRVGDNSSLESLEMAGVRLYENVKVYSSGGMTSVYYDDVFLAEHLDFFEHFPSLKAGCSGQRTQGSGICRQPCESGGDRFLGELCDGYACAGLDSVPAAGELHGESYKQSAGSGREPCSRYKRIVIQRKEENDFYENGDDKGFKEKG